ncbi:MULTISPECIES: P pilus assembly/Cpx signaling pathway, periplasmic inhibitor/zinc-resistance associated protein [unclassified Nodularia (in: cyanobacteria)]|uniref:P pilus assembly/Cpx signaling pathway, periplasmic inhibitor/zinc-resistance associated protein n=1 Tax=unclassified Nodularia (in: cyanobacteria) TaxID=2656917 RepID=UPI00188150EE|nr:MULTISPECIES: P pilus assembly/Cpx signaling pathway, periplasmic inhibitor/zinc-resistance associated protein [unclassified Nodularia (in: cyanobacteria)]MBE9199100.1 P pilus assembly/Cpx signaling pathway, periplasmic inhibitor/zinc-resistance associated protein [Nodularia sp. LEGE 06071]MCC2694689.1 P pilus assembly/Cpx signaling pathway, periplasmic inhibitor/zinc-resistance associated protein [Nodularia sp. LEGE 04288]
MKLKPLSVLAGAIALTVTALPFAVQAQMRSSSPLQMAQTAKKGGPWQRLNLTEAQKAQMQTIKSNTRAQIEAILTPEQKATLAAAKQAGQQGQQGQGKKGWANLNLTEQQKTQMRQIKESSQQQMQAVLTPEQRQQMQEMRQNMRSRGQQRNSQ